MSAKGRRNKAWEDENLTGWLTPARLVLRAFSSIPLAIVLLVYISLHATLASVPIGMIARIPTVLIYGASLLLLIAITVYPTIIVLRKLLANASRAVRFVSTLIAIVGISALCVMLWSAYLFPMMKYNPESGSGLLLFSDFVHEYRSTTIRRLPSFEMTETAFYAWWPMRLALVLFVINMVTATIRRIEFTFKNLGVLTVHTGIVTIAMGSVFYQKFKLEGDTLLMASQREGLPGEPATMFYDRQDVVLYTAQQTGIDGRPRYQQRPIPNLPRFNNYDLSVGIPVDSQSLADLLDPNASAAISKDDGRTLDLTPRIPRARAGEAPLVDPDINFRIVGYAPFATEENDWFKAPAPTNGLPVNPLRIVELYAALPGAEIPEDRAVLTPLLPMIPAKRVVVRPGIAMEYSVGMDDKRWEDLTSEVRTRFLHALVIEIPGQNFRTVVPASPGARFTLGETGWSVGVKNIHPQPPFPIITPGYEEATSSMVIVEITPPPHVEGEIVEPGQPHSHGSFDRWVYHRFPAINQDLHPSASGRPQRTDANPAIRVGYIDASMLQIYMDERPDGTTRTAIRQPGGDIRVYEQFDENDRLNNIVPNDQGGRVDIKLGERWEHAINASRPIPLPEHQRDATFGQHTKAFVAVEVSVDGSDWSAIRWLPFAQYDPIDGLQTRQVRLPDGRTVTVAFGRLRRAFPGFAVSLMDFQMIAYDHRGAPRDYQSVVRVEPNVAWGEHAAKIAPYEHIVKLNNPLRAPFHWDPDKSWVFNSIRRLGAGMNPDQFKLSQNGWDRSGWEESQTLVDQGQLDKPRASFTILGVGNNPGIHLIALGSVFMGIGIPWAFYVKPYLVRREKARIAAAHAAQKKSNA